MMISTRMAKLSNDMIPVAAPTKSSASWTRRTVSRSSDPSMMSPSALMRRKYATIANADATATSTSNTVSALVRPLRLRQRKVGTGIGGGGGGIGADTGVADADGGHVGAKGGGVGAGGGGGVENPASGGPVGGGTAADAAASSLLSNLSSLTSPSADPRHAARSVRYETEGHARGDPTHRDDPGDGG